MPSGAASGPPSRHSRAGVREHRQGDIGHRAVRGADVPMLQQWAWTRDAQGYARRGPRWSAGEPTNTSHCFTLFRAI